MVPQPWTGLRRSIAQGIMQSVTRLTHPGPAAGFSAKAASATRPAATAATAPAGSWQQAAGQRRNVLLCLIALTAFAAAVLLAKAQPMLDHPLLRVIQVLMFALLFAWVSAGFFTALMGFVVQLRGDRHALSLDGLDQQPIAADARTAIIMPICNEQVATVFAGLRATCESLATTSAANLFDLYILSDTSDPELLAAERAGWAALRESLGDNARVYYRWRQRRTRRKAGNVADFCRRWGRKYRYMVVLDADSVMAGDCLVSLVRLMEAHPKAGIIQTAPKTCGLQTLHARTQQFAGRVTGRLFTAGMQYWQLGESHYWGHNAIIRIEPFMRHCALAGLPNKDGSSSHILSHDFVEAALMGRAGFETWLAPDLGGSYEQQPPNLVEELQRDRRWCQGNLQNARLIAEPGLSRIHRAMLATGAMSYLSAPLWMAYLLLGTGAWLFDDHPAPLLDGGFPIETVGLWLCTATMLLLPRALGVLTIVLRGEQRMYGGTAGLIKGAMLEAVLSVLQAPVRMVAHTVFVLVAVTGLRLDWKSPSREAQAIDWGTARRRFGPFVSTMVVLLGTILVFQPGAALWLMPVGLPLILAIPLTVLTSQIEIGQEFRAKGLLVIPEEISPPLVLRQAWMYAQRYAAAMPQIESAQPATVQGEIPSSRQA